MISETTFSTGYSSFWESITPNSDRFIRRVNLSLERYRAPIADKSRPERRAFINEAGFRLFSKLHNSALDANEPDIRDMIIEDTRGYLERFDGIEEDQLTRPTEDEWTEISSLRDSILHFVALRGVWHTTGSSSRGGVTISPKFPGCGILDACLGDILIGGELVEVKAGDRPFRSTDVRQILTYCALNSVAKLNEISDIGCVNPRRGTYFMTGLETLCIEVSSKSAPELLAEIVYFLSSGDISR